ncbi:hypothetical protein B5K05_01345 [Rhizobium phaseoli]|uniref:hypothetical protein n=1 Tax=Rhizobium phaseoli TaxID=396 RepID=UPI000E0D21FC|nr:hypothetical protein [Rhizobium phaseoli]RDJ18364.1 hypothetical protein B5K04_01340 [Rhizobium phaseoli]RDJ19456.1 hypothetical protein B5K05_01345 [Rhizobium phaseoli]
MLAAVRSVDRDDLNLFCVALSMIASGNQQVPAQLKDYVVRIFNEAKLIAADVTNANAQVSPEAISLAFDLVEQDDLLTSAQAVDSFDKISPEIANKFLLRVEGVDVRN